MQCKNCGAELVRGFSFCLECGMPVPDEALEASGLPGRNIDTGVGGQDAPTAKVTVSDDGENVVAGDVKPHLQGLAEENTGKNLKPQFIGGETGVGGRDLKPKYIEFGEEQSGAALKAKPIGGEEQAGVGADVRAVLQESSSDAISGSVEKLVFCSNCGMRMQHNPNVCEKCGMPLGSMPNNNALSQSNGIPLFNNDSDALTGGFGGLGGFGGDFGAFGGNTVNAGGVDPMFNNSPSPLGMGSSADDLSRLNEQLSSFSSAGMPTINSVETYVRQKEPKKGEEREMEDFQLSGDLSAEPLSMTLSEVRVLEDYSMDEDPNADIDLDPYKFLGASMDEFDAPMPMNNDSSQSGMPTADVPPIQEVTPAENTAREIPKLESIGEEIPQSIPEETTPNIAGEIQQSIPEFGTTAENSAEKKPADFSSQSRFGGDFSESEAFIAETAPEVTEMPLKDRRGGNADTRDPENRIERRKNSVRTQPAPYSQNSSNMESEAFIAETAPEVTELPIKDRRGGNADTRDPQNRIERRKNSVRTQSAPYAQNSQNMQNNAPSAQMKRCIFCGGMIPAESTACPNCGRSLVGGQPRPTAPAPKAKSKMPIIVLAVIIAVFVAVAVIIIISTKADAAEPYVAQSIRQTLDSAAQLSENFADVVS